MAGQWLAKPVHRLDNHKLRGLIQGHLILWHETTKTKQILLEYKTVSMI